MSSILLLLISSCDALVVPARRGAPLTRREALLAAPAAFTVLSMPATAADNSNTVALLREARAQLDPCAQLIEDGNWDGVRTIVKTSPLANTKNLITTFISESGEAAEDLVVERQDLVQSLQLLDMAVYNNVFVGEQNGQGKPGAGVKVDRATPLVHLRESQQALDAVLAFKL